MGREAARTPWRRLDVEPEVLALGEPRETAVGAVADDRLHAREISEAVAPELTGGHDVVGSNGARVGGERQAEDLDEDRPPFTVWASTMTIDGIGSRSWSPPTIAARRAIARAQTPFARQRRHWA